MKFNINLIIRNDTKSNPWYLRLHRIVCKSDNERSIKVLTLFDLETISYKINWRSNSSLIRIPASRPIDTRDDKFSDKLDCKENRVYLKPMFPYTVQRVII